MSGETRDAADPHQ